MKKINITLTPTEQRALKAIMFTANPCESGCTFEEMSKDEKTDCPKCPYTKAYNNLLRKFNISIDEAEEN